MPRNLPNIHMISHRAILTAASAIALSASVVAQASSGDAIGQGLVGFGGYSDMRLCCTTGGGAGQVVHVDNRADFQRYAEAQEPYVIIIDADLDGASKHVYKHHKDEINITSNKTIIGAGAGKTLDGICLNLKGQSNVILRNLRIIHGNDDAIAIRDSHHIWVDHCDLSDSYDGLLDFTLGSDYLTCSWTKLHDHNKVSIMNSGTCHYEDYGHQHVTFAHCWFDKNTQRNPRIGYGRMHIYNCMWTDIASYCIGFHSQAQVLSENNYFSASAHKPFCNQYSDQLPYCGYLTDQGSHFANGKPANNVNIQYEGITYTPSDYYAYAFDLMDAKSVPTENEKGVGPQQGLQYQPILSPANGAIGVTLDQKLTWGALDGNPTSVVVRFGEAEDAMNQVDANDITLQPSTTYYWCVTSTVDGRQYSSPVYQFTTATEKASAPSPADGCDTPWLRFSSSATEFCTGMPLSWRPAADAKKYKVFMSDIETIGDDLIGEISGLCIIPDSLALGKEYYWRVDAIKSNGEVVVGDVWSFSTPKCAWRTGKNEAESGYVSGISFKNKNTEFSGGGLVRGDQGPGSIIGIFDGQPGTYTVGITTKNQKLGPTLFGISHNGRLVDTWTSATDNDNISTHTCLPLHLQPGDEIRIDFVSGMVDGKITKGYAIVDCITLTPTQNKDVGLVHLPANPKIPRIPESTENPKIPKIPKVP